MCLCMLQVCFEIVGYLLEELRDSTNFEAFKADVATANIFIGSLIFIEELADKVCSSLWEGAMQPCFQLISPLPTVPPPLHLPLHASPAHCLPCPTCRLCRQSSLTACAWMHASSSPRCPLL